ncbi:hypothetical protein [uncultured Erythrobacter sp.]|uniref:hypothetical protein n=1 Tax=uncultured Erythrobacter sp. TaxID=263913 RepID=UPI00260CB197|nr:hypothetical protein [uncultured Erythrobacter sp.]
MNLRNFATSIARVLAPVSLALVAPAVLAQEEDEGTTQAAATQEQASAQAAPAETPAAAEAPAEPVEITDRSHPDYVRCRREAVIGSRAQRRRVCLTNRQWAEVASNGNRLSNELVDDMRSTSVPNN